MPLPRCTLYLITERGEAERYARQVKRAVRFSCKAVYCEQHDAFHVIYDEMRVRIDERHRKVLEQVAQGLRDNEIAGHLGLTPFQVHRCVDRLIRRLNALSRANLIAIATVLGIITPSLFTAKIDPVFKDGPFDESSNV